MIDARCTMHDAYWWLQRAVMALLRLTPGPILTKWQDSASSRLTDLLTHSSTHSHVLAHFAKAKRSSLQSVKQDTNQNDNN